MKTLLHCFNFLILFSGTTFAQTESPPALKTWTDESKKVIYFLSQPSLKVTWMHLGADDDFWDQVSIDFSYAEKNPDFNRQVQALKLAHPNDSVSEVIMSGTQDAHLTIPSLSISEDLNSLLSVQGPYFSKTIYVPKNKSILVKSEFEKSTFLSLKGKVIFSAPILKSVETSEMGSETCDTLFSDGTLLFSVFKQFLKISESIDSRSLKYDSTKESLKLSILDSCLELLPDLKVQSFDSLLRTDLQRRKESRRILGETKKMVFSRTEEPFDAVAQKEMTP